MQFSQFAQFLHTLEGQSARLDMTQELARLYTQLSQAEVQQASYLLLGGLVPQYQSLEFQLSVKMVLRAVAQLEGVVARHTSGEQENLFGEQDDAQRLAAVTRRYKQLGDVGAVAEAVLSGRTPDSALSILDVYQRLVRIAEQSGSGSQERKVGQLVALLSSLDARAARYVVRIIVGKMRLGFSTMTMLDALSWAITGSKEDSKLLEQAYQKKADIGALAAVYLYGDARKRIERLAAYTIATGVPVVPALCQRLNSATEIIEKMGEVYAEPKYDGLRVQVHIQKGANGYQRAFTRNLEETTHMFPELAAVVRAVSCDSCILDAEAIGFDPQTNQLLPFQKTVTRKRKHAVAETAAEVPIRFYVFDVLSYNEQPLISEKLRKRKELLESIIHESEYVKIAPAITTSNPDELRSFHEDALAHGLEGAVMKQVDSSYQSGRKGWSWVKIKEEEGATGKLSDTLDLVVLGYYFGRGKRTQFGIGAFLVGVLDGDVVKTIAKIGTGLTDAQFRELKTRADALQTAVQPSNYVVPKGLLPDVWVQPELVVEIAADEITRSPVHTAGVALRFPRLVKFRDDKAWQDATTHAEVQQIGLAVGSSSEK